MRGTRITTAIRTGILLVLLAGCEEDEDHRLAEMAERNTERQAKQNEEVTALNRQVAEGTKRLAEAQATHREELVAMQHEMQTQRSELEVERKDLAEERRRESLLVPILSNLGLLVIGALPLILCWYLLRCLWGESQDQAIGEILTFELTADEPLLLPPPATPPANRLSGATEELLGPPDA